MDWYLVTKTIKGRRYLYRQRTWREGGRVRTTSIYVGPVGGAEGGAGGVNTTQRLAHVVGLERDLRAAYAGAGSGPIIGEVLPARPAPDDILDFGEEGKQLEERLAAWQRDVDAVEDKSKIVKAFEQVHAELELSEPGYRYRTGQGFDEQMHGVSSTFPQWVPEALRRKKLFERLSSAVDGEKISYPSARNASRQRALYHLILDRVDYLAGVDTSSIREKIMRAYGQSQSDDRDVASRNGTGVRGDGTGADVAGTDRDTFVKPVVRPLPDVSPTAPRVVEEAIDFLTPFSRELKGKDRRAYERKRQREIWENEAVKYGSMKERKKRQKSKIDAAKRKTRGTKALNPFLALAIKKKRKPR